MVDSAFKIETKDYLVEPSQQEPTDGHAILMNRAATSSIHQLSAWGMWIIGGSFPRLKDPPLI